METRKYLFETLWKQFLTEQQNNRFGNPSPITRGDHAHDEPKPVDTEYGKESTDYIRLATFNQEIEDIIAQQKKLGMTIASDRDERIQTIRDIAEANPNVYAPIKKVANYDHFPEETRPAGVVIANAKAVPSVTLLTYGDPREVGGPPRKIWITYSIQKKPY
jgi:hypothetical protein